MSSSKINVIDPELLNLPKGWVNNYEEEIEKALAGHQKNYIDPELLIYDKIIKYFIEFLENVFTEVKPYNLTKYYRFLEDVYQRRLYANSAYFVIEKFYRLFYKITQDKMIKDPIVVTYDPDGFKAFHFDEYNQRSLIKVKHRYRIISGRHRAAIAVYLKMKDVPVYVIQGKLNIILTYWGKFIKEAEPRYLEEIKNTYVGGSDYKYHSNINKKKERIIYDAIMEINPKTLVDIGCNTGKISHPFSNKGIKVTGIDMTNRENLEIDQDYNFIQQDITKEKYDIFADVILFLSVYHHIIFNVGLKRADEIFYNIFDHSKYLIFDSGNPEESGRYRNHWIKKLQEYFKTEKELLDHFGLRYKSIGKWFAGYDKRNYRSIVIFNNKKYRGGESDAVPK